MHARWTRAADLTSDIIAAAIEVHRDKGPGLLEAIYEWCLSVELRLRGFQVESQDRVRVRYKGFSRIYDLRFDLRIEECVLVEVKAVESIHPIHKAQLLSYMKLLDVPLGLIINFHNTRVTDGIARMMLPGANR